MAHRVGQKEESKAKILKSAGRGFRSRGFGGSGVDGLAKDAEVTSGAFYAHFKSKADAFREAVVAGLEDLKLGVSQAREQLGSGWRTAFIDFYLGERRTCDLAESCALQSLSTEVARATEETRIAYERELQAIIETVAAGLDGQADANREEAIALLALLAGGVTLARAVQNPDISNDIAAAVRKTALELNKRL